MIVTGPAKAEVALILAHGAGGAMDSPFLSDFAQSAAARGISVIRFEFAYMAARRLDGKLRPPPPAPNLIEEYRCILSEASLERPANQILIIGGKSLGGRIASLIADKAFDAGAIHGLVCLGYPFHPPGRPEKLRTSHLEELKCPALIVQGERDPFGSRAEVERLRLSPNISIVWAGDGDHDLRPRRASGLTHAENLEAAVSAVATFAASIGAER